MHVLGTLNPRFQEAHRARQLKPPHLTAFLFHVMRELSQAMHAVRACSSQSLLSVLILITVPGHALGELAEKPPSVAGDNCLILFLTLS